MRRSLVLLAGTLFATSCFSGGGGSCSTAECFNDSDCDDSQICISGAFFAGRDCVPATRCDSDDDCVEPTVCVTRPAAPPTDPFSRGRPPLGYCECPANDDDCLDFRDDPTTRTTTRSSTEDTTMNPATGGFGGGPGDGGASAGGGFGGGVGGEGGIR